MAIEWNDALTSLISLLARLYPGKRVRAALLWTETPELTEISVPALDAELASALHGAGAA